MKTRLGIKVYKKFKPKKGTNVTEDSTAFFKIRCYLDGKGFFPGIGVKNGEFSNEEEKLDGFLTLFFLFCIKRDIFLIMEL